MSEKARATNWAHLDPAIRPIAAQKDLARAHHILEDLYMSHPPAQHVERQIEQLMRAYVTSSAEISATCT